MTRSILRCGCSSRCGRRHEAGCVEILDRGCRSTVFPGQRQKPYAAFSDAKLRRGKRESRLKRRLGTLRDVFRLPTKGFALPGLAGCVKVHREISDRRHVGHDDRHQRFPAFSEPNSCLNRRHGRLSLLARRPRSPRDNHSRCVRCRGVRAVENPWNPRARLDPSNIWLHHFDVARVRDKAPPDPPGKILCDNR
jgi:hypothetical protein